MPANRHAAKAATALYASTLVDALSQEGGIQAVMEAREQMEQVISYNRKNVGLMDAMRDPAYTPQQRSQLIQGVFETFQPALKSVLGLMAERGEIDTLPRVYDSFNESISEKMNTTIVDVVTRVPLDDHLRKIITDKTSADLGQDVVLQEQIDPYMLGGIIMSANGRRIDASVDTMLENARRTLKDSTDGGE